MDNIEIINVVNGTLWGRSSQESRRGLIAAGDAAVYEIMESIGAGAEGRVGAQYWWNGAKELCEVLAQIGSPLAQSGLIAILETDSPIVEFVQVRACAAQQLAVFCEDATELVPRLREASKRPHAPLAAIQETVKALGT